MKRYYITEQLIYVTVEKTNDEGNHSIISNNNGLITFKANVYTNALCANPKVDYLCGIKVEDEVIVSIPNNTPSIIF